MGAMEFINLCALIKRFMIQKILLFIFAVFILQSCGNGIVGIKKNDQIDQKDREEIRQLNAKLLQATQNNDVATIESMMSPQLWEGIAPDMKPIISEVNSQAVMSNDSLLDEYEVQNKDAGVLNTFTSGKGDNAYKFHFVSNSKSSYVSLLLVGNEINRILVTIVYGNVDGQWKINLLYYGQYALHGKTAPAFYRLAKANYEKGNLITARNYADLSQRLNDLANHMFSFSNTNEMNAFYNKVSKETDAQFHFPIRLEGVSGKPGIFSVHNKANREGLFTAVSYVSSTPLQDSVALKAEYLQVKKATVKLFKGINDNQKYVFYEAYNELPGEDGHGLHYVFLDTIAVQPAMVNQK